MHRTGFLGIVGCLLLCQLLCSCWLFTLPSAGKTKLDARDSYWMHYDATRRGGFLLAPGDETKVLSEPSPDVALARVSSFLGKLSADAWSAEVSAKVSEKLLELGKRTEMIMFLRESLYRLSELAHNSELDAATSVMLYLEVLDACKEIVEQDRADADAKRAEAETERAIAAVKRIDAEIALLRAKRTSRNQK